MNVTVTLEHRFDRTPDGTIWTEAMFAYPFWERYLEVFERVGVIARVRDVPKAQTGWQRATGKRVHFWPVPHFIGPAQYLRKSWRVRRAIRAAVVQSEALILRTYGIVSLATYKGLQTYRRPFGVEVVADPYDAFVASAVDHPLRPLFRKVFYRQVQRQCNEACAVAYVTEQTLQRRYPAGKHAYVTHYSDVELHDGAFVSSPRTTTRMSEGRPTLINIGSFNLLFKAQDVLVDAVALCVREGLDLRLILVGDGRYRTRIEERVVARKLQGQVRFVGQLPAGDAVRAQLDEADLFVLPSRTEGLPRAMIEAMARGLPCVGSTAGGIPELLRPEDMVPCDDPAALADKIRAVVGDPQRMSLMSHRSLQKARSYHEQALRERQLPFLEHLKYETGRLLHHDAGRQTFVKGKEHE